MKKVLIVLQENSGYVALPKTLNTQMKDAIYAVVDSIAEDFEDMKTRLQGSGKYHAVHLLTDTLCKPNKLLETLIAETRQGRQIDLFVLGHGSSERLYLNKSNLTGGVDGSIRKLLKDAKAKRVNSLNLRLVFMCNCYGSTLNDDWIAIGAKASVGSLMNDYMPEPMITFLMHNWLNGQKISDAAKNAYEATIPFYLPFYPPTAKTKYKKVKIPYPCPTPTNPFAMGFKEMTVPDGVQLVPNQKIVETALVVHGDKNIKF